jgi:hypothetical protein
VREPGDCEKSHVRIAFTIRAFEQLEVEQILERDIDLFQFLLVRARNGPGLDVILRQGA